MPSPLKVLFEAVIVGLLLIPMVYLGGYIAKAITGKPNLPDVCSKWNKYYIMEVNIFIAGFLFHIWAEYTGINAWYVRQYE